jgi:hypothetical protein
MLISVLFCFVSSLLLGFIGGVAFGVYYFFLPACELIVAIDDDFPEVFPKDLKAEIRKIHDVVRILKGKGK